MAMKIDHIGIAVESIEKVAQFYKDLELDICHTEEVKDQQVKASMIMIGESRIELLESLSPEGPIGKFIAKKGPSIHHIAIEVQNLEAKLKELEEKGYSLIDKTPRMGAGGNKIAFVHPKSSGGVLIELCEKCK
ncbi:MAG: methylmalonyl-CoA epimerase [Thermoanaerobaculaceae bacterium]|nr:methylmalonyl-CoA epimerase [Thermoanaerobaculaceae bacterium]